MTVLAKWNYFLPHLDFLFCWSWTVCINHVHFLKKWTWLVQIKPSFLHRRLKERETDHRLISTRKQPKFCVPREIWCLNRKERWYSINKQGRLQLLSRRLLFEKLRRVLHKILYGEAPPRVPHTYHLIHQTEKVTLSYIFYWQMASLSHTNSRTNSPFNWCKCTIF